jgi:hypothetical protein
MYMIVLFHPPPACTIPRHTFVRGLCSPPPTHSTTHSTHSLHHSLHSTPIPHTGPPSLTHITPMQILQRQRGKKHPPLPHNCGCGGSVGMWAGVCQGVCGVCMSGSGCGVWKTRTLKKFSFHHCTKLCAHSHASRSERTATRML